MPEIPVSYLAPLPLLQISNSLLHHCSLSLVIVSPYQAQLLGIVLLPCTSASINHLNLNLVSSNTFQSLPLFLDLLILLLVDLQNIDLSPYPFSFSSSSPYFSSFTSSFFSSSPPTTPLHSLIRLSVGSSVVTKTYPGRRKPPWV